MKETRRLRISLETHEITTVKLGRNTRPICRCCGSETQAITIAEAVIMLRDSLSTVMKLKDIDTHVIQKDHHRITVCERWLSALRDASSW